MDRDVKLVDAVWNTLKKEHKVDAKRVYVTGFSNGGGLTYCLWASRPELFAAFAPIGAIGRGDIKTFTPRPVMHVAGKRDWVAAYERQVPIIDAVREVDGCENTGKPWARDCLRYPSPKGTPVVTYIFDGASHVVPADAPA